DLLPEIGEVPAARHMPRNAARCAHAAIVEAHGRMSRASEGPGELRDHRRKHASPERWVRRGDDAGRLARSEVVERIEISDDTAAVQVLAGEDHFSRLCGRRRTS